MGLNTTLGSKKAIALEPQYKQSKPCIPNYLSFRNLRINGKAWYTILFPNKTLTDYQLSWSNTRPQEHINHLLQPMKALCSMACYLEWSSLLLASCLDVSSLIGGRPFQDLGAKRRQLTGVLLHLGLDLLGRQVSVLENDDGRLLVVEILAVVVIVESFAEKGSLKSWLE